MLQSDINMPYSPQRGGGDCMAGNIYTRHSSKAFDRYLQAQADDQLAMAQASTRLSGPGKGQGRVYPFKKGGSNER